MALDAGNLMAGPPVLAAFRNDEGPERSVEACFEEQVDRDPARVALRAPGQTLTFDDLDRWANRVAWRALETRGETLEPMALLVGRGPAAIAGMLAAFKAGKISLFLDGSLPRERLRFLLEDAGAGLLVGGGDSLPLARMLAEETGIPLVDVDLKGPVSERRPGIHVPPETPAYIVYTSGSEGVPKGVVNSHGNLLWNSRVGARFSGMTASDKALLVASPGAGQGLGLFQALLAGAAVYPFDVRTAGLPALRDWLAAEEITLYQSVPAVFRSLARTFRSGESFPSLRVVRLGGDTVRREDVELFQRHFSEPCRLRISYGSSETGPIASHFMHASTPLSSGPVPVGRPYEGVEVRLLDEDGREAGPNEVGEITVRSRHLALGYWRQEALTRERFLPDPSGGPERICRTGDLGQLRSDGLLVHRGRKDLQVKIRGNRVEVGEVEEALRRLPGIEDAAVASCEGPDGENRLVGYVVWKGRSGSSRALRAGLSRTLPDHMVPAAFVSLPELPLTARGKVDRAALKAPEPESASTEGEFVGARDDIEKELVVLWEGLLGIRPIGVRHDFFELGGDSLLAVELFALIERRMGRYLPLSSFLHASTIELLAKKLREAPPREWPCLVPMQILGSRPPFFCVSWAEGEVLAYGRLAARLGPERPVYGLRRDRLEDRRPRHTRVEDMAAQYIDEIRAVQPAGPYHIGGLSGGAVMAFEMAQQLRAAGQKVGALVLLEPPRLGHRDGRGNAATDPGSLRNTAGLVRKVRLYWAKWQLWGAEEWVADLRRRIARLRRRISPTGPARPESVEASAEGAPGAADMLSEDGLNHVDPYVPREYPGRATLFLARHERFRRERLEEWQSLVTGGLEVREIPGIHAAIVQEPFVRVLARQLEECLSAGGSER
jgi:amino acid adenylation domain-containing protein